ncbi:MAG: ATP-binding cassette domain-containing protein [Alphaproteobacteria bacterium]|nr:ATP-binding cassette domain-containing protein [Alphaproteobacteria bacterium]
MSASITLSNLSWSLPDGQPLLSDIDLTFSSERTGLVGRNGAGKTTLVRLIAGELHPQAGSVSINGTLGRLRQVVQTDPGLTIANLCGAAGALDLLRRAEAGEASVDELAEADWTVEARLASALARLGLEIEPDARLGSLSGGQQTRAALAALVFAEPDFLVLDEPTNNLDRDGRQAVVDLLAGWRGGAIVVSHDRDLLETMDAIVELNSLGAARYGGNWSRYRARKSLELSAAQDALADAERHAAAVARSAQAVAERKARKDSVGRKKAARGDMPKIMVGARKNRSEGTSGAYQRLADNRRAEAEDQVAAARARLEILQQATMTLAATGLPAGKSVLQVEGLTGGHVPGQPVIRDLSFSITGPERVAVTGPNGSGKTTFLALLTGKLTPSAGTVRVMARHALLDQRVSLLDASQTVLENFRRINPQADDNACRRALARYMFRAEAALQTVSLLSGGQMLRAGLACVLGGTEPPQLLILDEPTNHLDIESIEAVEAGLRSYDGALLVVSHDEAFLEAVGVTRRLVFPAAGR